MNFLRIYTIGLLLTLLKRALINMARGFLMGGADIIPGVSGGTIALILGIYERLISAISRIDREFLLLLRQRRFLLAAIHIDLFFLFTLLMGIALGIVSLAGLMHDLLTDQVTRPLTVAAFFGLILASSWLVAKQIKEWTPLNIGLLLAAAMGAFMLTGLTGHEVEPSLPYLFICGAIAICAMILPGISGAFILVLLGVYVHVTGAIKDLPRGEVTSDNLLTVGVFCAGCLVGLLSFSKFLKYMLAHHHAATMAVLSGFIFGSLRKVWPFQKDLFPELELKEKVFVNYLPREFNAHVAWCVAIAIGAVLLVLITERLAGSKPAANEPPPIQ